MQKLNPGDLNLLSLFLKNLYLNDKKNKKEAFPSSNHRLRSNSQEFHRRKESQFPLNGSLSVSLLCIKPRSKPFFFFTVGNKLIERLPSTNGEILQLPELNQHRFYIKANLWWSNTLVTR